MNQFSRKPLAARFRPTLDRCEDRATPAAGFTSVPADAVAVAPDSGGVPVVRIVNPTTGADIDTINAYEDAFRGGVHAALGDVTGDGVRDIVLSTGAGGGPRVRVIDGKTGDTLRDFFVYEPSFTGGVSVAVGDVNGDGRGDIVTGTGVGGGPRVRVLDGKTLGATVLKDYFAYEDTFRGGVQVASGDVDGDGLADVIAGTGVGGGPRVQAFSGRDDKVLANFFAYEDSFRGGVQVAAGDLDGDGKADILVGAGVGGGPVVKAVSGADGKVLAQYLSDDPGFRGGVRVDSVDANGDGRMDLVARTRRGNDDTVRVFDSQSGGPAQTVTRRVDDNPSAEDAAERPAAPVTPPVATPVTPAPAPAPAPAAESRVEGSATAVNAAAGTVTVQPQSGAAVTVKAGTKTKLERNGKGVTLAAFKVGDKVEARVGADGVATKLEATGV